MSMNDFPATPFPSGVEMRRLGGFRLDVHPIGEAYGLCENCNSPSVTHIFNVANTQHHLCAECFGEMLRSFSRQSPPPAISRDERNCDVYRDYDKAFAVWRSGTEYGNFGEWLLAKKEALSV